MMNGALPVHGVEKRKRKSQAGAVTVKVKCAYCPILISCAVLPSGKRHEAHLRRHEKNCTKNPDSKRTSTAGKKVGELFGVIGSGTEFQAPEKNLTISQGSSKLLDGAIHMFPGGDWHPVVGKQTGMPIRADLFFGQGVRCCFGEENSMLQFRVSPELYPKLYENGRCVIAEIGTEPVKGAPKPWTISQLRLRSLNFVGTVDVFCLRCMKPIKMNVNNCARGQGPCNDCTGTILDDVPYRRSFQAHLDATNRPWTTVPDARTILANHQGDVQFQCNLCQETWFRCVAKQYQQNSGCPGCSEEHLAERCAYTLYKFVFPDANMNSRGKVYLHDVHANPFDIASKEYAVIVEIMSLRWHVEAEKLPNDTAKMLAALRGGYVYIMAHSEDYRFGPDRFSAWKRCIVAALRLAKEDATPRMIHVRRDAHWTAYDCMGDVALEAGFTYEDIFCGNKNAHATERLPDEIHTQKTLM